MTTLGPMVEVFWRPGCSSCLRMKEFMSSTGIEYEEINVIEDPGRAEKLIDMGLYTPAVCVDEECVSGTGLDAVAGLIGVPYERAVMLYPEGLKERYVVMLDAACRFIAQMTPEDLARSQSGRDRPMLEVANQTVSVIRGFLAAYYDGVHDRRFTKLPSEVRSADDLLQRAAETRDLFQMWWERDGSNDPLDRVIDTPWWGHRTLHEVFDREVWHTAQHTRQLMLALEASGRLPDRPLTKDDFADLQLPEGIDG